MAYSGHRCNSCFGDGRPDDGLLYIDQPVADLPDDFDEKRQCLRHWELQFGLGLRHLKVWKERKKSAFHSLRPPR